MALFIYRRDLRLEDNPALTAAAESGLPVHPIFILDPVQTNKKKNPYRGDRIMEFMVSSIPKGTMVFEGETLDVLKTLLKDKDTNGIRSIYFNRDYTPFALERDSAIMALAEKNGVDVFAFDEATLLPPGMVRTKTGGFFKKFTPFKTKFLETLAAGGVTATKAGSGGATTAVAKGAKATSWRNGVPSVFDAPSFTPKKLKTDLTFIVVTKESPSRKTALGLLSKVSKPDPQELFTSKTSGISPFLKFGIVSVRETFRAFHKKKFESLIEGLIWRDFYYNIAVGFPEVLKGHSFREEIKWWYTKQSDKPFVLWTQGKTGFPIVDACMRELAATGNLGGRGRMIVGSFLTKLLFVDWRLGEQWFAKTLLDYDPAVNNGNWQWVAGCGVDVQPYVRIFNPTTQGLKHDPDGTYVKHWVPELKDLSVKEIYDPKRKTIVDYKEHRELAMELFRA